MQEQFYKDLSKLYELLKDRAKKINSLYSLINNDKQEGYKVVKRLLKICSLKPTKQNKIAVLNRLIALREDLLILCLEGREDTKEVLAKVYEEVAQFHMQEHEKLLHEIEEQK
ncbi:MAG: hypothetical protein LBS39_01300, partial [Campylobacteraceae bacterium]|nr:hypothetical protein [Campylobacteraceae bacterium]